MTMCSDLEDATYFVLSPHLWRHAQLPLGSCTGSAVRVRVGCVAVLDTGLAAASFATKFDFVDLAFLCASISSKSI